MNEWRAHRWVNNQRNSSSQGTTAMYEWLETTWVSNGLRNLKALPMAPRTLKPMNIRNINCVSISLGRSTTSTVSLKKVLQKKPLSVLQSIKWSLTKCVFREQSELQVLNVQWLITVSGLYHTKTSPVSPALNQTKLKSNLTLLFLFFSDIENPPQPCRDPVKTQPIESSKCGQKCWLWFTCLCGSDANPSQSCVDMQQIMTDLLHSGLQNLKICLRLSLLKLLQTFLSAKDKEKVFKRERGKMSA